MSLFRVTARKLLNSTFSRATPRQFCTQNETGDSKSGYAKAYEKFEELVEKKPEDHSFTELLRKSTFMDLGDSEGKVVQGKIFHVVEDDLYIDFGWKFHCVCSRPKKQASSYVRGAKVRLRIRDLELSSKFLGYDKDLTLLESDCTLLGLVQDRRKIAT